MAHNYTNTASNAALDGTLNSSAGSFSVTEFTGYPSVPFYILMDRDTSSAELMEVTGVAGSTLTVNRGSGGTAGTSHSSGATVEHVIPAAVPQSVEQHVEATSNVHGVTGVLIGADSTGTLANKTFRGAHTHVYSDTLPDSPSAGFLVTADNSAARDGIVVNNTGANADRNAMVLRQSGSDRVNVFYDGTVKVTPSGAATRPAFETTGSVKAENFESTDDITAAGDITAQGTIEGGNLNGGNVNISGTLTSTGNNAFGTVTAAGAIQANAAGTGLTVANTAEVGTLNVTNGNAVLSGSNAKLRFPSTVASPTAAGSAKGEVRFRTNVIDCWDGTEWRSPGVMFGASGQTNSSGTVSTKATVFSIPTTGIPNNAPYRIMVMGQCELNNVTDGVRFDLVARLDDAEDGEVITTGLGNGFTQTATAFTGRLTGSHTVYFRVEKNVGGAGSATLTAFNQFFTAMLFADSTT